MKEKHGKDIIGQKHCVIDGRIYVDLREDLVCAYPDHFTFEQFPNAGKVLESYPDIDLGDGEE